MGKILRINLTNQKVSDEKINEEYLRKFMGGAGLGLKLLYDEVDPKVDPLSPNNKIFFTLGFLCGTQAPAASRVAIITKSPLTNGATMTNSGGYFPAEMRYAGADVIIVEGKAEKPVYIWIKDGKAEIRDATQFWGMNTIDTQHYIQETIGDRNVKIACIGPAAENGVLYASIINERRAAGRKGVGTVMGAKNLKAIAVRGTEKVPIRDEQAFKTTLMTLFEAMKKAPNLYPRFSNFGTAGNVEVCTELGNMPAKNFLEAAGKEYLSIGAREYINYRAKRYTCYRCPVGCGQVRIVKSGRYAGFMSEGPEFETIFSLGSAIGVNYAPAIIAADRLCDEYGMDTISAGVAIGFAMELYEKGIIDKSDTDGLELKFGNHEAAIEMLRKIAYREGIGNVLADGVKRAAQRIGRDSEKYAIHVKGLEPPGYDPRGAKAMGLNYMTAYTGADHSRGYPEQEIFGFKTPYQVDRFAIEGKADLTKYNQDVGGACKDCTMFCTFVYRHALLPPGIGPQVMANLWKAVTGIDVSKEDVIRVGERLNNVAKAFNIRAGMTRADDWLPERLMKEPLKEGNSKNQVISPNDANKMLDEYYSLRGWDKNGIPSQSKLLELGLDDIAKDFAQLIPIPVPLQGNSSI